MSCIHSIITCPQCQPREPVVVQTSATVELLQSMLSAANADVRRLCEELGRARQENEGLAAELTAAKRRTRKAKR